MPRPAQPLDKLLDPIARRLAGAARPPEPEPEPDHKDRLAHIAELSKNARATWFGLIGLCLFVGITLLGHKDADFFAYGAETKLPLVNVDIPVWSFFFFAPVLVAALYIYLHLYLMNLWDALAKAPARIGGRPLADAVFPWLISHAALWYRNRRRRQPDGTPEGSAAPRALGWVVATVSLALGWLFGLIVLGGLWARSMPAHDEWLTLWIAACFWCATTTGAVGLWSVWLRMRNEPRETAGGMRELYRWGAGIAAFLLFFLSWETTEGGLQTRTADGLPPWLYRANLAETDLTGKPSGTVVYEHWVKDYEVEYRKREDGKLRDASEEKIDPTGYRDFIMEAVARFNAPFESPNLQDADLRRANMDFTFLPGADLRRAEMQGASFEWAELQGADLFGAGLQGAKLKFAKAQGAYFGWAEMQEADLSHAMMQGASLYRAKIDRGRLYRANLQGALLRNLEMEGADLRWSQLEAADLSNAKVNGASFEWANMQGADFRSASMHAANLANAKMQNADFSRVQMPRALLVETDMQDADLTLVDAQGSNFYGANMQGVDLRSAKLQGTDLRGAKLERARLVTAGMQGANLSDANLEAANCSAASFEASLVLGAILTCEHDTLSPWRFERAVGDYRTVLPEGISVASCLESLTVDEEAALLHHPNESGSFRLTRRELRDALLCSEGIRPVRLNFDPFERRYWDEVRFPQRMRIPLPKVSIRRSNPAR